MATDVKVIKVTRSENRYGNPMWILNTAGGDSIYVFDNMLEGPPWDKSKYRAWFEEMENQQADRWQSFPILATAIEKGKYLTIISLQAPAPEARPDRTPEAENLWEVYGPRWWSALHALGAEDSIVFDTETTGVNPDLDEAVSIAVRSYASPSGAPVKYHSLIAPRFPEKLLERNANGECAYDIHGIHPADLAGQPLFPAVHQALWEIMWEKNWVCWNTDFDVALLDSLCLRHRLPLIPRKRVVCAMRLLSPLAGKWDAGRSAYRKAKLEEMAQAMDVAFPDAHDAAADVKMTIAVLRWAYAEAHKRARV